MFERFSEESCGIIFTARKQANQRSAQAVSGEHLLLALIDDEHERCRPSSLQVFEGLIGSFFPKVAGYEQWVDLPISPELKRIFGYAIEEAGSTFAEVVTPDHLLIGILREKDSFAKRILEECGINLADVRDESPRHSPEQLGDPDLRVVVDRCAIVVEQEGHDAPHVFFKTMDIKEHLATHSTALESSCRWLERKGWIKSATRKEHCQAYYERGSSRAYVTSNLFPLNTIPED
jgi:ATP-dependent Clp protease ATP-binding subunit ClpA